MRDVGSQSVGRTVPAVATAAQALGEVMGLFAFEGVVVGAY